MDQPDHALHLVKLALAAENAARAAATLADCLRRSLGRIEMEPAVLMDIGTAIGSLEMATLYARREAPPRKDGAPEPSPEILRGALEIAAQGLRTLSQAVVRGGDGAGVVLHEAEAALKAADKVLGA